VSRWTEDELRSVDAAQEIHVSIEDADGAMLDQVDAAYRQKYRGYASIVDSITDAEHRATTLRLAPREAG
jgi:hypothetical protein